MRNLERAGVQRSASMKLVGHKTESIYRRHAIVAKQNMINGLKRMTDYRASLRGTSAKPKIVTIRGAKT